MPELTERIRRGELLPLRDWSRDNVHRQGYRMPAEELIRKVTGQGLTDADFLRYLKGKYGALYGISL
jgi:carboxypeptidase Taq